MVMSHSEQFDFHPGRNVAVSYYEVCYHEEPTTVNRFASFVPNYSFYCCFSLMQVVFRIMH